MAGLGSVRAARWIEPPAQTRNRTRQALAAGETGGGELPDRAVSLRSAPRMHLWPARDLRARHPAANEMPGRPGSSGDVGPSDRARIRLPRPIRLPTARPTELSVLLLDVGLARVTADHHRVVPARRARPALRRAPGDRSEVRDGPSVDRPSRRG